VPTLQEARGTKPGHSTAITTLGTKGPKHEETGQSDSGLTEGGHDSGSVSHSDWGSTVNGSLMVVWVVQRDHGLRGASDA
jgi:hypothetical protein